MVMRCVFKHHVYLCVVSTALMAGLSLITSHTSKAYANQNCGSGSGAKVVSGDNKPIVCDSRGTRTLNSSGGGEIKINMDKDPGKSAAVTVRGPRTEITIIKKLKVTGSKGGGLPVINVLSGGKLTLVEEVDVMGAGIQKEIVVEGSESSVTLKGKLTGFEGVQVNNGGMVVLGEKVTGIEGMKVKINDGGGMVRFDENVTFNNGEAGIQITGDGAGKATVMGVGRTMTVTKGSGVNGIQMDGAGTGKATVMGLKIMGSGGGRGKGVDVQNGREMTLMGVEIEGFKMGVNAQSGTVKINGESTITVTNSGTGLWVGGTGNASMMGGKIMGSGGGNYGVQGSGTGTVELTKVEVSGFKKGVDMTAGKLVINMGEITFKSERGIGGEGDGDGDG
ncbi:hypothetical protein [Bartonella bovis]|nr:hypothetical protein [Bartonella bovis]